MPIADRLAALGITLPPTPTPLALYQPAVRSGNLIYVSGQINLAQGALTARGKVGEAVSIEQAQQAARLAVLNALAAAQSVIGSLDRVTQVVRLTGYVASAAGFTDQPKVVNGASELLRDLFGDAGVGARSAVGMAELPLGAPVEIELILEVRE